MIPHLESVTQALAQDYCEDDDLIWAFVGVARFYEGQGLYRQAEGWNEQCLQVVSDRLGSEHPAVATSLNNLAGLYRSQGRYSEAEPLYQQALQIDLNALGEDHPDFAIHLHNLAGLYTTQGRYAEAELLYLHALTVFYQRLGEAHPYTEGTFQGLASLIGQAIEAGRSSELSDHPMTRSLLQKLQTGIGQETTHDREPQD